MASGSELDWVSKYYTPTNLNTQVAEEPATGAWEYAPEYVTLSPFDPRHRDISKAFHEGWMHPHKRADIIAIYHVIESAFCQWPHGQRFNRYLTSSYGFTKPKLNFHGTQRTCTFGNPGAPLEPCWDEQCHFCCILWRGFRLENSKFGGMFGPGIYSSESSSKADHYIKNPYAPQLDTSHPRAILVCRVVCDRPQKVVGPDYRRREPDAGYNCVEAKTKNEGGSVKYPETIVYREDAIAPVAVVVYSKVYVKGEKST